MWEAKQKTRRTPLGRLVAALLALVIGGLSATGTAFAANLWVNNAYVVDADGNSFTP